VIALDTSVLVRTLVRDDPEQAEVAARVMASERLWLCKTVLLETEWVLRYRYKFKQDEIDQAFRKLLGFRRLEIEDRAAVGRALSWYKQGMDFAEALHLASSRAYQFVTFDREMALAARGLADCPSVDLLPSARFQP
jgi:predicted nucleic-acid-binding protein